MANRRILVTGAYGFLGSHLVEALRARGEAVVTSLDYDLRRERSWRDLVPGCNVLIHLAARVGGIGANRAAPSDFYADNALMNTHAVNAAIAHHIDKMICLGSVCAYPKHTPIPFCETDLWNGYPEETNAPYGLSKRNLLVHLQAARQQYGLNGVMLIPTNLYGPRDHFELERSHVIPALIRRFDEAKDSGAESVTLWGSGKATRDFLYVTDAVDAIVAALDRYDGAQPLNIGSGQEISICHLAETIARLMDYRGEILYDANMPDGQPRRVLDISCAKEALNWKPRVMMLDGLKKTIDWRQNESSDLLVRQNAMGFAALRAPV